MHAIPTHPTRMTIIRRAHCTLLAPTCGAYVQRAAAPAGSVQSRRIVIILLQHQFPHLASDWQLKPQFSADHLTPTMPAVLTTAGPSARPAPVRCSSGPGSSRVSGSSAAGSSPQFASRATPHLCYAARRERVLQRAAEVEALVRRMEVADSEQVLRVMNAAAPLASPTSGFPPARRAPPRSRSSSWGSNPTTSTSISLSSAGSLAGNDADASDSDADAGRLTPRRRYVARARPLSPSATASTMSSSSSSSSSFPATASSIAPVLHHLSTSPGSHQVHTAWQEPPAAAIPRAAPTAARIMVCAGKACTKHGGTAVLDSMQVCGVRATDRGCWPVHAVVVWWV